MKTKRCSKCGEVKTIDEFHRRNSSKAGVKSACKACMNIARQNFRKSNRDKEIAYRKERVKNNHDKVLAASRKWRINNPDKQSISSAKSKKVSVEKITNSYISHILRIPIRECTKELFELKREQLKLLRITRELKKELKDVE